MKTVKITTALLEEAFDRFAPLLKILDGDSKAAKGKGVPELFAFVENMNQLYDAWGSFCEEHDAIFKLSTRKVIQDAPVVTPFRRESKLEDGEVPSRSRVSNWKTIVMSALPTNDNLAAYVVKALVMDFPAKLALIGVTFQPEPELASLMIANLREVLSHTREVSSDYNINLRKVLYAVCISEGLLQPRGRKEQVKELLGLHHAKQLTLACDDRGNSMKESVCILSVFFLKIKSHLMWFKK
jgi:hypothetical protein